MMFVPMFLLSLNLMWNACAAEEMIERTITSTSKSANPVEARREIQDEASQEITEELVKELLGQERFLKNRTLILTKVGRASARFLPFLKPGTLEKTNEGFSMPVTIKANLASLRQVLQENGLLNENTTAPILLPMVSFEDRVNSRVDRWWLSTDRSAKTVLRGMGREFEGALRTSFLRAGFHVIRPQTAQLTGSIPKGLRLESRTPSDSQLLGDWFGAPLIVDGTVSLQKPADGASSAKIEVKLAVVQTANNRPIADVSRSYLAEAGSFDAAVEKKWREVVDAVANDLAGQVLEAWQKGSVGSSQLRLVIEPRPSLPEIESLKEKLKSSSAGIRSVRERLIAAQSVVLEVDSPVAASELARRLKGFPFNGRTLDTSVGNEGEVRVRWPRAGGTP